MKTGEQDTVGSRHKESRPENKVTRACSTERCKDKLRIRLSDDSGALRFEAIEIVAAPQCRDIEATLREYLVGRSLADVDLDYMQGLQCAADGECMRAVIREVENYQRLFLPRGRRSGQVHEEGGPQGSDLKPHRGKRAS